MDTVVTREGWVLLVGALAGAVVTGLITGLVLDAGYILVPASLVGRG